MGSDDLPERELLQGLIKLAAAHVHAVRGNPAGVVKNLEGARERLAAAGTSGKRLGLDAAALVAEIENRLARVVAADAPPIAIPRTAAGRRTGHRPRS
jgi:predicted metal-dependent hydrolase